MTKPLYYVIPIVIGFFGYLFLSQFKSIDNKDDGTGKKPRFGSGEFFDGIASVYDATNKVMTFGLDISWRKQLLDSLDIQSNHKILDLATGTADVAIMMANHIKTLDSSLNPSTPIVIGLDPSESMLSYGRLKIQSQNLTQYISLQYGNSETMPQFTDDSFDRITMSFGIRNVEYRNKALLEMKRLLSIHGKLGILEFSQPQGGPLKELANIFLQYILPNLAGIFTQGHYNEYIYLQESIFKFPNPNDFKIILEQDIGFKNCIVTNIFQYIVYSYVCDK